MTSAAEWLQGHQKEAAGAAGVVLVAGFALWRSRRAAPTSSAAAGTSADPAGNTAGLSGIPDTLATDIGNQTQDQLNAWYSMIMAQVGQQPAAGGSKTPIPVDPIPYHPKPPTPGPTPHQPPPRPKTPTPAPPPPAWKFFTIPAGGSLYAAAAKIYGHATPANVQQLASWNGIKLYQRNGTTYADVYPGQRIKYR